MARPVGRAVRIAERTLRDGLHPLAADDHGIQQYIRQQVLRLLDLDPLDGGAAELAVQLLAEVESGLGRLVVADILRSDARAVHGILQEGVETVVRRDGGDVQAQLLAVRGAEQHFFAPVAVEVAGDGRVGLAAVVDLGALEFLNDFHCLGLRIELLHVGAVHEFAAQVTVPPHGEVDGVRLRADDIALVVAHAAGGAGPHLPAGVGGIGVDGHRAAHVGVGRDPVDDLAGSGVHEGGADAPALVADPDLQFRAAGDHGAEVHRVAVAQAVAVQARAVVVDAAGAVDDLVTAVAVHIGGAQVVVALAIPGGQRRIAVRIEEPAQLELLAVPVPSGQRGAGVVAAAHHRARMDAVQISDGGQVAVGAVGVAVAPGAVLAASRDIVHRGHRGTGAAVEDGQVLLALHDAAQGAALVLAVVSIGVADHLAGAVLGGVGGLADHLRAAVAVEVVDDELGVVGAGPDVAAEIDPPQALARELDTVDVDLAGVAVVGIVVGVGRIPFQEDLIFAVPVHVAHGAVIGRVDGPLTVGHDAVGRCLDGDGNVAFRGAGRQHEAARFARAGGRPDFIGGRGRGGIGIHEEGHVSDGLGIDFDAVAEDVELDVRGILGQVAPGHEHLGRTLAHGDDAASEVLHLQLAEVIGRLRRRDKRAQAE